MTGALASEQTLEQARVVGGNRGGAAGRGALPSQARDAIRRLFLPAYDAEQGWMPLRPSRVTGSARRLDQQNGQGVGALLGSPVGTAPAPPRRVLGLPGGRSAAATPSAAAGAEFGSTSRSTCASWAGIAAAPPRSVSERGGRGSVGTTRLGRVEAEKSADRDSVGNV